MKDWIKNRKTDITISRMQKRLAKTPTPDLPNWAEQCMNSLSYSMSRWDRASTGTALEDASMSADALSLVLHEMKDRAAERL